MQNCQVEVYEWPRAGKPIWTGKGYNRVYDNSQLDFVIDDIPTSSEFDLVVRYDKVLIKIVKNVFSLG